MTPRYTAREVARILKLPEDRLRSCLRAALFPSRQSLNFTFQDLVLLKTTKGLLDARVPVARIRRILQSLKRQLPAEQQLWSVRIFADGRRVVVWDAAGQWHPDSGQFLFDFEPRSVAEAVPFVSPQPSPPPSLTAEQWFDVGLELESHSPQEALAAYLRALELAPEFVPARVNIGRLQQLAQNFAAAEVSYRAALQYAPDDSGAAFNLAVLLEDMGDPAGAMEAYRQAVAADPSFRDAHYNLGLLYESRGRKTEAIRHFSTAQRLSRRGLPSHRVPSRPRRR